MEAFGRRWNSLICVMSVGSTWPESVLLPQQRMTGDDDGAIRDTSDSSGVERILGSTCPFGAMINT